jgi:hypothetical protein
MSEQSQGGGWWQASDGKWYPPQSAPGADPTVPVPTTPATGPLPASGPLPAGPPPSGPPPSKGGLGRGPLLGIIAAVVVLLAAVLFFATKDDGGDKKDKAATTKSDQSSDSDTDSSSSSQRTTTTKKPNATTTTLGTDPLDITVGDGFVPFRSEEDGFAVAVPQRMKIFDLSSANLDQIKEALGKDNPQLAAVFDQAGSLIAQGGKLFAVDPTAAGQGKPADTMNILRTPGSIDPTTKSFSDSIVQQLEGVGATDVQVSPLDVPAGKAVAVDFTLAINLPDGTTASINGHEGVVQAAGALWVITYAAGPDADPGEFSDVVNSFVAV